MRKLGVLGVVILVVTIAAIAASPAAKQRKIRGNPVENPSLVKLKQPVKASDKAKLVGTIAYDTGTPVSFLAANGWCVGNQFNTANGQPVLSGGQITRLTVFLLPPGNLPGSVWVSIYDQVNPTNGTAPILLSTYFSPTAAGTWYVINAVATYAGASFLAGMYNTVPSGATTPAGDTPGLDTNTVGGQGYHAMAIRWNGANPGTGFTHIGGNNALVRATGNILVPVELMGYSVN